MLWISKLLCLLGLHGPKRLGYTSQFRSAIPDRADINHVPHRHRTCFCCGAKWEQVVVAKKFPFEWKRVN